MTNDEPIRIACTARFQGLDLTFEEEINYFGSRDSLQMSEFLENWFTDRMSYNWRHHPRNPNAVQACFKLKGFNQSALFGFDSTGVADPDLHVRHWIASRLELAGQTATIALN